ncbi:uncharacterized protein KQ657_004071 [Scheffersomyces spartinae]|uniref:beta-glucosidase n=1 Tax=Scheffersomyces spartinae TaxID=45513 RepID=A0A9P7VCG2_9ASCO|nr:uncharacterized protein KQ657_004071 [Scheffersomyces spartinae]KAG7194961.1 hypothetical protein KQ657_004071 [Scheffersomyces spartinae]
MKQFNIEETLNQLTDLEKAQLLAGRDRWHTTPIPRLNIPSVRLTDGPNGLRGVHFFPGIKSACFPCGTCLGSTWNPDLMEDVGKLMAVEAYDKNAHVILGPTVNIQRGPNGGRGFESFSEDPLLSGNIARGVIEGIQSGGVGACLKHFICNDMEDERFKVNVNVNERSLREIYALPFEIPIKHENELARPISVMSSYNKVNGQHASSNYELLTKLLRENWGFKGTVMSDWYGTYDLKTSIEAGLELEMPGPPKIRKPEQIVIQANTNELHQLFIDDRVRSMLKFINWAIASEIPFEGPESETNNTPETAAKLRKYAEEGIVLLKNDGGLLPLNKDSGKLIAVIGPNAKNTAIHGGGSASVTAYHYDTPFLAISTKLGKEPTFSVGVHSHKFTPEMSRFLRIPEDKSNGFKAKVYLEPPTAKFRTLIDEFKLTSPTYIRLPDYANPLIPENNLYYIDFEADFVPDETGDYEFGVTCVGTAQLFVNNQLVVDNKTTQKQGTSFYNTGTEEVIGKVYLERGKSYPFKVEFGSGPTSLLERRTDSLSDKGGALAFGAIKAISNAEKEIVDAVEVARTHDIVIAVVGLSKEWESEGYDRTTMDLPGLTYKLIEEVAKVNKNLIVVNQSGTPVNLPFINDVPVFIQSWFSGSEGANALANILFGDVSPLGKLSLTFPKRLQDNPAYLNFKSDRGQVYYGEGVFVGYRWYEATEKDVMFPFGFGLSYSTFEFSDLAVTITTTDKKLKVSLQIENKGGIDAQEVVQVYVSQKKTTVSRPPKELKSFTKVFLKQGETQRVELQLDTGRATAFWDEYYHQWCSEKGEYDILVGNSSDNILLSETITLEHTTHFD